MNATIPRRDAGVVLAAVAPAASTAGKAVADVDVASAAVDLSARMTKREKPPLNRGGFSTLEKPYVIQADTLRAPLNSSVERPLLAGSAHFDGGGPQQRNGCGAVASRRTEKPTALAIPTPNRIGVIQNQNQGRNCGCAAWTQ